jgi:hypothetical protein
MPGTCPTSHSLRCGCKKNCTAIDLCNGRSTEVSTSQSALRFAIEICSSLYLLVLISIILRVDGLLGKMTDTVYGGAGQSWKFGEHDHVKGSMMPELIALVQNSCGGKSKPALFSHSLSDFVVRKLRQQSLVVLQRHRKIIT